MVVTALSFSGDTLAQARHRLAAALAKVGREPAALDARYLLETVTGLDHAGLLRDAGMMLDPDLAARLAALAHRRLGGEPLSRILGERDFRGLTLAVRPGVLDPRPDTEAVVDLALTLLPSGDSLIRILDLGTGSGALLCGLLSERPEAFGIGVDLSAEACTAASDNLSRLGLARRAAIVRGDWSEALRGPFDLVVANPPYIESAMIQTLPDEVRSHDPRLALDGGPDGLGAYRAILAGIARVMAPSGLMVFETGASQQAGVTGLIEAAGLRLAGVRADTAGHVRAVAARFA